MSAKKKTSSAKKANKSYIRQAKVSNSSSNHEQSIAKKSTSKKAAKHTTKKTSQKAASVVAKNTAKKTQTKKNSAKRALKKKTAVKTSPPRAVEQNTSNRKKTPTKKTPTNATSRDAKQTGQNTPATYSKKSTAKKSYYYKQNQNSRDPESTFEEDIDQMDKQLPDYSDLPNNEKNALKLYLNEIGKVDLLTPQQEVELAARIKKGDEEARRHMIQANLRLVVKIARDYSNFGLPLLDLISEGNVGLVKAVERFDPQKGGKLSTYASWWIKQSIKRALANQSKTIRLPVHLVDKIAKMRKITARLQEELEREPTNEEMAQEMGMPVNKVAHLKSVSLRPSSLDAPVSNEDDTEFGELVGDENADTPYETLHSKSMLSDVNSLIQDLDEREADIIRMRFGLQGDRPMTLEEVGLAFDITRERVRQLQHIALTKMRKAMKNKERQRTAEEVQEEDKNRKRMEVLKEFYENNLKNPQAIQKRSDLQNH